MRPLQLMVLDLITLLSALSLQRCLGNLFSMLSTDQQYIVDTGVELKLRCEFYKTEFNLFDNPVQWKKFQYGEESEINIMGNIKEPFGSTGRFTVTYDAHPPRFVLILKINDMSEVDSGNYTCEVKGPRSAELGLVKYTVFTRAPIQDLYILQGNKTITEGSSITFIENEPSPVKCVARGGSPPPEMEIFVERVDYTQDFRAESSPSISGVWGFRILETTTVLESDSFKAASSDSGKKLKCKSKVPGLAKVVRASEITVNYGPEIICSPPSASVNDRNVRIDCDVMSRPDVRSWYWILDENGTRISEGEIVNEYWTMFTRREGLLHLQLYIRQVSEVVFRTYFIVATNDVSTAKQPIILERKYKESEMQRDRDDKKIPTHGNRQRGRPNRDPSSLTSSSGHVTVRHYSQRVYLMCAVTCLFTWRAVWNSQ